MWHELAQQVGVVWIVLVFLAAAVLIALTAVFFFTLRGLAVAGRKRFQTLDWSIGELPPCRIENLPLVKEFVGQQMNPEFQECFDHFTEDSEVLFGSSWVPDPSSRLPVPEVLTEPMRAAFRKTLGSAVLLGGVAATTLALSSGYVLNGSLADAAFLRFVALLPLIVSALGMLTLYQASELYYRQIRHAWQRLMVCLERKLPVFTQAAETAIIINQMKDYDARMSQATLIMAEQVQSLASGKLVDAVSNAVKYVMAATVAPSVNKSTESLALLAQQLEKEMQQADRLVAKLYSDMENRQHKQSELWFKRYQEISEVLAEQQNTVLKNISVSEKQLVDDLGKAQKFALEKVVDEQSKTIQHVNGVTQKSWTLLQEKLSQIIDQLADGQTRLLTDLTSQQQQTLTTVSLTSQETASTMRAQYDGILQQMRQTQADLWDQLASRQTEAYAGLLAQQKESFDAVSSQQQQAYQQAAQMQQEGLQLIKTQQVEAIHQMADGQSLLLQEIDQRQLATMQAVSAQQATALQAINQQQALTLRDFRTAQTDTLSEMSQKLQFAVQHLADTFAGDMSGKLASYLDPISLRLRESSEALISAQVYAKDVKDVLKLQNDAATTLQVSIRDLFAQLVETRQTMSDDLVSLKASSGIMSEAAASMSSVYAGSQSGLSEAISQMSSDLMRLSEVLSSVMSTSAEQTRLMQSQSLETYEVNQKHLDAVRGQINLLSDELSTRIDQLMLGFTNLTEDLVKNINNSINTQNDTLGGSLRSLTEIMSEEARSMSLFAQQINMDIDSLNQNLRSAVGEFDTGMRAELSTVLSQFDAEVADIVKRLALSATQLGDAVESLPEALRLASQAASGQHQLPVA